MPRNANQSKQSNYSIDFDGSSQYIAIAPTTATDMTGYNTIALWVKRAVTGVNHYLFTKRGTGPEYAFFIETTNLLGFDDGTGSKAYGNTVIPSNVWTHVAVVVESGGCVFYVNGVADGGAASGISVAASTNTTYIGRKYNGPPQMNGQINEVCFFDYALSASQITTLWGGGTSVSNPMALPSPPIAYYPLGESAGGFVGGSGTWLTENNAIGDYVFDFDGSNVNISNTTDFAFGTNGFTISLWVSFNALTSGGYNILDFRTSGSGTTVGSLWINSTNGLRWYVNGAYLSASIPAASFSNNTWYNIIVLNNGSTTSFYLNGTLIDSGSDTTSYTAAPLTIGDYSNGGYALNGKLSNVQIFNTDLTDGTGGTLNQIETLYNYGSPIQTLANIPQNSNLKAWYKLDASEVYNSSTTEWEINQAQAPYQSSVFCPNVSGQVVTDYLEVSNYSGTTGKTAASWSFWYNTLEANSQGGWLSGGSAEFKRNASGQQPGMEFTLHTDVGGVDTTWGTYFAMPYGNWYIQAPESQVLNKWINVVLTYDQSAAPEFGTASGSIILYVNGVKQATSSGTSGGVTNPGYSEFPAEGTIKTSNLIFGGGDQGARHVSASLSNYATWDKALTQAEINEIVNGGQPKNLSTHSASSNLISWWTLENLTTGLVDNIGGYNASIVGSNSDVSSGSVSTLNGESSGMSQANLVQSDLQTVAPYSKYAIEFDHADSDYIDLTSDINLGSTMSFSVWLKTDHVNDPSDPQNIRTKNITGGDGFFNFNEMFGMGLTNGRLSNYVVNTSGATGFVLSTNPLNDNIWHHCFLTFDGSTLRSYIDGSLNVTIEGITTWTNNIIKTIGRYDSSAIRYFDGILSNMAVWNSALTASQAREVYNEGLPSNLHNFSGAAPVAWWQLGESSSYAGGWTFANEIGSINGEGQNLTEINLTNGVGTTANGVSASMGVGSLVGDAPYSTANAISSGMAVTAKGTDVP